MLFGATCIILTGIWAFLKIEKNKQLVAISYLITGFLAGKNSALPTVSLVTFGTSFPRPENTLFGCPCQVKCLVRQIIIYIWNIVEKAGQLG